MYSSLLDLLWFLLHSYSRRDSAASMPSAAASLVLHSSFPWDALDCEWKMMDAPFSTCNATVSAMFLYHDHQERCLLCSSHAFANYMSPPILMCNNSHVPGLLGRDSLQQGSARGSFYCWIDAFPQDWMLHQAKGAPHGSLET